jgi:hypothetical protein
MSQKSVSVAISNGQMRVQCPFNELFIGSAHKSTGTWDRISKCWVFDARNEVPVRKLLAKYFGTDGDSIPDVVSLRVRYAAGEGVTRGPITLFGRIIARAEDRDGGAEVGSGVLVESGGFTSGGSRANWCTEADRQGAVVVLHDFPRKRALQLVESDPKSYEIVKPEQPTIDVEGLTAERQRLAARIAEIDAALATASIVKKASA